MASKRDLVEAHAYNRRRLVSAFVSGAPGGREVESVSRTKPVVAGVALAAVVLGGAAIAGFLNPALPDGWDDAKVIIGKSSAARFVAVKGTLYPVLNATSARLQLPSNTGFQVIVVDDDKIAASPRGPARGILGAPDDLPPAKALLQTGWVSCLAPTGSVTTIATGPGVTADPAGGVVVRTQSGLTLLAGGYRYGIPEALGANILRVLGKDKSDPLPAPGAWVDLFTDGRGLRFALPASITTATPLPPSLTLGGKVRRVGQLIRNASVNNAPSVVLEDGTAALSDFAAAIYSVQAPPELAAPVSVTNDDLAKVQQSRQTNSFFPATWPRDKPADARGAPCAVLDTAEEKPATTRIMFAAPESPWVTQKTAVSVEPGRGALVRASSTGAPSGPVYVIDQSGQKFAITDPSEETLTRLGYQGVTPRIVPAPWMGPFASGPALNEQAALASVSSSSPAGP